MPNETKPDKVLEAAKELQARRAARESIKDFILYTYPRYIVGKHHQLLFNKIDEMLDDANSKKRLMVFFPPRYGKSVIVSERLPAYYLAKNPDKFVLMASYEENLATSFGRKVRNLVNGKKFQNIFPGITVAADSKAAGQWSVEGGMGGFYACGIGSGLTGRGANLAIIDDPVKDRQQADSPVFRERVKQWYQSVFETRLYPDSIVILCMTRWHHDDLAGWLMKQEGADQWDILHLKANIETNDDEKNDPLKRKIGETLWPEKWSVEALKKKKQNIGPAEFEALYQGHPTTIQGKLFKRDKWRFWNLMNLPDEFDDTFLYVDLNVKEGDDHSETAMLAFGTHGPDFYLLDGFHESLDFVNQLVAVENFCNNHPHGAKVLEAKANGPAVVNVLRSKIRGMIEHEPGSRSKEQRATAVSPYQQAGNIYIPEDRARHPWVQYFINQCAEFPYGDRDDFVDCLSGGINWKIGGAASYKLGFESGDGVPEGHEVRDGVLFQKPSGTIRKEGDMTIEEVLI